MRGRAAAREASLEGSMSAHAVAQRLDGRAFRVGQSGDENRAHACPPGRQRGAAVGQARGRGARVRVSRQRVEERALSLGLRGLRRLGGLTERPQRLPRRLVSHHGVRTVLVGSLGVQGSEQR